ncbi:hypothetical protein [Streptomyces cellostaticus]|nr:hypothetical protein [Streptomyces cellostaticus]GHI10093.1 hypothetical protein Scel_84140 [Streptomyces cellostaticus]
MEALLLELQELPETDDQLLEPMMCCDTGHTSFDCTDYCTTHQTRFCYED